MSVRIRCRITLTYIRRNSGALDFSKRLFRDSFVACNPPTRPSPVYTERWTRLTDLRNPEDTILGSIRY